jgi:NAD(P)-dependent dehydrogenase (short-subunit alcohol dehydrogenase family)
MAEAKGKKKAQPPQKQSRRPGIESEMQPRPRAEDPAQKGCDKLQGRVALITGGDSGIGRAVAALFAKEGANVSIVYLNEHADAEETKGMVEKYGRRCILIPGDIGDDGFCTQAVERTLKEFRRLDVLVNNAAEQHPQDSLEKIDREQLERTFRTNVFGMFFMTKAAMKHLKKGSCVINTTSVTAYEGNPQLIDYSATKGAMVAFTRALSKNVAGRGIRVNGVAPGPIWTPLIPSTFDAEHVASFGKDTPMERPGQPEEVAPSFVFLASDDASYMSGQVLHCNGGEIVNG